MIASPQIATRDPCRESRRPSPPARHNPWIHNFAAYDAWAKPLGLLILAAILRAHGCRVSYSDCLDRFHPRAPRTDPTARHGCGPFPKSRLPKPAVFRDVPRHFSRYGISPDWLREDLRRLPAPDLVLVTSGMTYWYTGARETIACLKEICPASPLIRGGVYASLLPEHARRHSGADEAFSGPAEAALLEIVKAHTGWGAVRRFAPDALDTLPFPAWDLQRGLAYVPLVTTRGCQYACVYCAAHLLEPRRLRRSPASVVEELAHWHRGWGLSDFVLYDDAFLADLDGHALPVLEAIARSGLRLRFHTPNALHIRGITPEAARLLFAAGFTMLRLGLETADFEGRPGLDQKLGPSEFEAAVAALKVAGFTAGQIGAYLLVGLPGERRQAVLESIAAVQWAGIVAVPTFYSLRPRLRAGLHEQLGSALRQTAFRLAMDQGAEKPVPPMNAAIRRLDD